MGNDRCERCMCSSVSAGTELEQPILGSIRANVYKHTFRGMLGQGNTATARTAVEVITYVELYGLLEFCAVLLYSSLD